jgi:hypothetical protein
MTVTLMTTAPPEPDPRGYRAPTQATGRLTGEVIYIVALAVTAGADVVAFDQVLSIIISQLGPRLIDVAVAGFTAMSLTLAHFAGRLLRDRAARHGAEGRLAAWLLIIPWALLGLAAFAARLILAQSELNASTTAVATGSASSKDLASAFLFLILYLASGAVAGFGEYLTRNPYRAHYRKALRAYQRALRRLDRTQAPYERALSVWELHEAGRQAEQDNHASAADLVRANADELKRYAAFLMAAHLQDPAATDGMTLPDRIPLPAAPGPAAQAKAKASGTTTDPEI